MSQMKQDAPETGPGHPAAVPELGKRHYEAPRLVEWGSIHELTAGPAGSTEDDDFSGTSGV